MSNTTLSSPNAPTYYRVGIVKPHGHKTEAYLALFTSFESASHFENSNLFGAWVTNGDTVLIPSMTPVYVGEGVMKITGKSESQASMRNRLLRGG